MVRSLSAFGQPFVSPRPTSNGPGQPPVSDFCLIKDPPVLLLLFTTLHHLPPSSPSFWDVYRLGISPLDRHISTSTHRPSTLQPSTLHHSTDIPAHQHLGHRPSTTLQVSTRRQLTDTPTHRHDTRHTAFDTRHSTLDTRHSTHDTASGIRQATNTSALQHFKPRHRQLTNPSHSRASNTIRRSSRVGLSSYSLPICSHVISHPALDIRAPDRHG